MKRFLQHCSKRFGYDGWALQVRGSLKALDWTVCTTRDEARKLRHEVGNVVGDLDVVKVRIKVEVV